jgi:Leucine-rich repeat (LRR) protein
MMKTAAYSHDYFAAVILTPIVLSSLFLTGCSPSSEPQTASIAEPSLAQQLTAIRNGSTDIILIESTPLDNEDLDVLIDVPGLKVLHLDHADNTISDAGLAQIAKLTQLEQLRIRGGSIGDKGLKALATMPHLKVLNLPQGRFTDAGLAQLKTLPKLQMLRIGSARVTDAGIAELKDFPSLARVHLIDIPITDLGLVHLQGIPRLESLYLDGANISDAAVDQLFAKRPDLHVHFNQAHHDRDPHKDDHPRD